MSLFHDSALVGASGQGGGAGYEISRSLRFNSSDSAFLSRTFSAPTGGTQWTYSAWVKRVKPADVSDVLLSANISSGSDARISFFLDNTFYYYDGAASLQTTASYRDFSAWMHIVFVYDSPNATSTDRLRLYINGVRITSSNGLGSTTYPSQNTAQNINTAKLHKIGDFATVSGYYANMYLAEVFFIDGQALTPSSFGEFDVNGIWQPKAYTGTYGTNGFRLPFSDNSAATATTLGKDAAGSNNWTPNNLSVTAGAGNDSLVDSPTNYGTDTGAGGEVRGNYATLNPLAISTSATLANGNLDFSAAFVNAHRPSTVAAQSGKWYCEFLITGGASGGNNVPGLVGTINPTFPGSNSSSYGYYGATGAVYNNSSVIATYATFTDGDVISVAFDADSGKLWFAKNGTWQGSGNPATGANPTATASLGTYFFAAGSSTSGAASCSANFGQRPWAYQAPSGFKALCTQNLPTPTGVIAQPSTAMDVALWTGNGNASRSISFTSLASPDLVWLKSRSNAFYHGIYDTVRGVKKVVFPNDTLAEIDSPANGYVNSFDSAGFTLASGSLSADDANKLNSTYVAWCWDAGSSTVTDNTGSIQSTRRTNAGAGISIVSWTGNATNGATVGHGLGVKPHLVIYKNRTDVEPWPVISDVLLGAQGYLYLNSTAAKATAPQVAAPTSTVLTLSSYNDANGNGDAMIAYCFAPVAGYSAFGSYTGNGSADGPFVYTGFRPRWILRKRTDSAAGWVILDTARGVTNVVGPYLLANASDAEASADVVDILSNGFKVRESAVAANANGGTYVWAAFAESPFQFARAR